MTERIVETKTARGPKTKRTVVTVNQAGSPALLAAAQRLATGSPRLRPASRREGGRKRRKGGVPGAPACGSRVGERGRRGEREKGSVTGSWMSHRRRRRRRIRPRLARLISALSGAACLAEIERRQENAAADPQRESAVRPDDQGRQNLPEERSLPERREVNLAGESKWPGRENTRTDEMGQAVVTRMEDDIHSQERQPPVSAGFSTRQPRPVVETGCTVRGRTRRKTSAAPLNRPILIATARVRAAAHTGRSRRHGMQLRKGVGAAAGNSGYRTAGVDE